MPTDAWSDKETLFFAKARKNAVLLRDLLSESKLLDILVQLDIGDSLCGNSYFPVRIHKNAHLINFISLNF
jgi:hypothetical protein